MGSFSWLLENSCTRISIKYFFREFEYSLFLAKVKVYSAKFQQTLAKIHSIDFAILSSVKLSSIKVY